MEEVVKELTAWVSSGPNWPYALVQLNKDTCRRHQQLHLWKNQPTGGPPASCLRFTVCLPSRAKWTWGTHHSLSAWVLGQWHKPNWRRIHLLTGQYPTTHRRRAGLESIAPWQMLPHPNSQPPQDHSPKTGKGGQHDHGGEESPVSGNVRHARSCVRELDPKETKPYGHTHTSTPHAKRSPQAGGHIITGEHSRGCWDGRSIPRGSPHHHLSHSCDSRVQECHPSCRHKWPLREGQQGPRGAAGH